VINPKVVQHNDDDLWLFAMLPDVGQLSTVLSPFTSLLACLF
jgi:hypothetical protein